MKRPRNTLAAFVLVLVFTSMAFAAPPDLTILHINDTHGNLLSLGSAEGPIGGIARLATLIARVRAEQPGRVLLLHAGDIFSRGDPITCHTTAKANFRIMNHLGYDALTPGNGDFYWGLEPLLARREQAQFPFLHANVLVKETGEPLFTPYVVKEIDGLRVGILGLGTIAKDHPSARTLQLDTPLKTARRFVPELRAKADVVIALCHLGHDAEMAVAAKVGGIDIVIGGHKHMTLDPPMRIPRDDGTGTTVLARAGGSGCYLGRLDLWKAKDNVPITIEGHLIPVEKEVPEDLKIAGWLAEYDRPLQEILCRIDRSLPNPEQGTCPVGDFAALAVRDAVGADGAIIERGALRAGLEAGDVTLADVYRVHPWRNDIVLTTMTGRQLETLLGDKTLLFAADFRISTGKRYTMAVGSFGAATLPKLQAFDYRPTGKRVDEALAQALRAMGEG